MSSRKFFFSPLVFALLLLFAGPVARGWAQQWQLEAQAGRLRYEAQPAVAAETAPTSLLLGLRYDAVRDGLRLYAGVPLGERDPYWGAAAAWKRLAVRRDRVAMGVDLLGHGFAQRERGVVRDAPRSPLGSRGPLPPLPTDTAPRAADGFALAAQVLPVLAYEARRFQAQARAGVSHYYTDFAAQSSTRSAGVADLQLTAVPAAALSLTGELRHVRAPEANYSYAGATALFVHGPAALWASAGQWLQPGGAALPWHVGGTVQLGRAALTLSARRDAFDPLYGTPPGTFWGLGLGFRVGGRSAPAEPVPASYADGQATILLPVSAVRAQPKIAGDFTDWKPRPMTRAGEHWSYTVALEPGVYNYAFVSVDGEWFVPESVPGRKDDGMGGHVAVLVVR